MTTFCSVRVELKPRFKKPQDMHLIKVTTPFKRLDLDFKGPLPSQVKNKYILTITDAYSRFPFVYACSDLTENSLGQRNYFHVSRIKDVSSQTFL